MEKIEFQLETVTPLMMSGADRTVAELRPGQIEKGIRWWWRWARGPEILVPGNHEEADIFGSTDGASRVIVRIKKSDQTPTSWEMTQKSMVDAFKLSGDLETISVEALKYVLFPYREDSAARGVIYPQVRFRLSIGFLPGMSAKQRNQVLGAFWLLIFLGGIGTRSRRGVGAIRVVDGPNEFMPTSDLKSYLTNRLASVLSDFGPKEVKGTPAFACFSTTSRLFLLNCVSGSWQEAFVHGISLLKQFRNSKRSEQTDSDLLQQYQGDLRTLYAFLGKSLDSNGITRVIRYTKSQIGLPIGVNLLHANSKMKIEIRGRLASPIMIKVLKLGDGSYRTVIGVFPSIYAPSAILAEDATGRQAIVAESDFDLVQKFIDTVEAMPDVINLLPVLRGTDNANVQSE